MFRQDAPCIIVSVSLMFFLLFFIGQTHLAAADSSSLVYLSTRRPQQGESKNSVQGNRERVLSDRVVNGAQDDDGQR